MKKIRRARPDECAQLSELAFQSKAHWGYSEAFMAACRAELTYSMDDIQRDTYYVLIDEQTLIGFYGLIKVSDTVYELAALFVKSTHIGRGYGRDLIDHVKQTVKASGGLEIVIQSDPEAAYFYIKAGGIKTGVRESESIPGRYLPLFSIELSAVNEKV